MGELKEFKKEDITTCEQCGTSFPILFEDFHSCPANEFFDKLQEAMMSDEEEGDASYVEYDMGDSGDHTSVALKTWLVLYGAQITILLAIAVSVVKLAFFND